jgi:putative ABC transport system permease protein
VVASLSNLFVELRQEGGAWADYPVRGVDEAYLDNVQFNLAVMAEGYDSAQEVWQALNEHPGYAVIDAFAVPSREQTQFIIGGPDFKLDGVFIEDETMAPITLEVREPSSQATFEVTVIGVMEQTGTFGFGLFTSQETLDNGVPFAVEPTSHFIQLADGVDPAQASNALESAFLKNGLQSVDQVEELRDQQAAQDVIQKLLLGFLTLGLVVGVAALGVISTRAVVERRQQIGMLRALGFQSDMVSWAFLIESSFVALLGIVMGASLAIIPAYQLVQDIASDIPGLEFEVPWPTIIVVMSLAYAMAVFTTWLPSRQAAAVLPAEALRYE